jgi:hypothetical protein
MNCPADIADIITQILQTGLLRIRPLGWSEEGSRCAAEADHLHNLPGLLRDYSPDRLQYYWDVERPSFIQQSKGVGLEAFTPLWDRLAVLLNLQLSPG